MSGSSDVLTVLRAVAELGQEDVLDVALVDVLGQSEKGGELGERDVGEHLAAQRRGDVVDVPDAEPRELLAQRDQDLLLAHGAPEVLGDVVVPRADVLHRLHPVHVLGAGQHRHTVGGEGVGAALDVIRVVVVHHRVAGHDVDAPHLVDEADETLQPDPDVVVDLDLEVLLHGGDLGVDAVGASAVDLAEGLGDLAAADRTAAPRVQGHVEVARQGEHGHAPRRGVDPDQDHRLGAAEAGGAAGGGELAVVVGAHQQHGEGGPRPGHGGGSGGGAPGYRGGGGHLDGVTGDADGRGDGRPEEADRAAHPGEEEADDHQRDPAQPR